MRSHRAGDYLATLTDKCKFVKFPKIVFKPSLSSHRTFFSFVKRSLCSPNVLSEFWIFSKLPPLFHLTFDLKYLPLDPLKPDFSIVISIQYKPRIAVAIIVVDEDDMQWVKNKRKLPCIGKPVPWKFSF